MRLDLNIQSIKALYKVSIGVENDEEAERLANSISKQVKSQMFIKFPVDLVNIRHASLEIPTSEIRKIEGFVIRNESQDEGFSENFESLFDTLAKITLGMCIGYIFSALPLKRSYKN